MVVVTPRVASHIGVIAVREIEPLHDPEARQDLERPEDRRPRRIDLAPPGIGHEVGRLEGPVAGADQAYDGPPRGGHPVAGVVERLDDIVHRRAGMAWHRDAHDRQHIPGLTRSLRLSLDSAADWGRRYQPQTSNSLISIGTEYCVANASTVSPRYASSSIQPR